MTAAFLLALAASLSLGLWLTQRQIRCVRAHRATVPAAFEGRISDEAHARAADYTVAKMRFRRLTLLARAGLLLAWTLGGGLNLLAARASGASFLLLAFGLTELAMLPFTVYALFRIEERFGFNRTTKALFASDLLRTILLALALGWPLAAGALWLMRHAGTRWWIWMWAGWCGFSLLLAWIYPAWIAPLFNRFSPLRDQELRRRIEGLLDRAGFRSDGLFVMDGSRRSTHANAYFTGWGSRKRIVLFDTLCAMLDPPEIEAVLAHELGHCKLRHLWSHFAVSAARAGAGLALLDLVLDRSWFSSGLGVSQPSDHAGLLLFLWVAPLFTFPLQPLWSAWSRRHEYEADAFAGRLTSTPALVHALVKMYAQNASTLTPDPLYSAYHDSHPPAAMRVARLESG